MNRVFLPSGLALLLALAGCSKGEPEPVGTTEPAAAETDAASSSDVELGAAAPAPEATDAPAPMPETTAATASASAPPEGAASTAAANSPAPTPASDAAPATAAEAVVEGVDLSYLSDDAAFALMVRPSRAFGNELVQGILAEATAVDPELSVQAKLDEMREATGMDVSDIDHVLMVLDKQHLEALPMFAMMLMMGGASPPPAEFEFEAAPAEAVPAEAVDDPGSNCDDEPVVEQPPAGFGPGGPGMMVFPTVVVQFNKAVDQQKLLSGGGQFEEKQHAGKTYAAKDGGGIYFTGPQTAIFSTEENVKKAIDGQRGAPGALAEHLRPIAANDLALALDVRPLHGMIGQMAQNNPNPVAAMAGGLVKQVNTLIITADLNGTNLLQVKLHAINEGSAEGLQGMLGGFLEQGKLAYNQRKEQGLAQMTEAQKGLLPVTDKLVLDASVTVDGTACVFTVPRPEGIEKLPSLVRPLMEEAMTARAAARERNKIFQIGLAFHNYHDLYGAFPAAGGPGREDAPGQGLSWRVHLLPLMDQQALYEEFHLDEPWDSEHNKSLLAKMPAIFGDDPEGNTSVHLFVGEHAPFADDRGPRFQEITDGTSNTILVAVAGNDTAQPWTKPGGLEFDREKPVEALGEIGEAVTFQFMDGAVHSIAKSVLTPELLRNLVQHNDGNPVQVP